MELNLVNLLAKIRLVSKTLTGTIDCSRLSFSNIIIISFISDGVFSFMETFEKQSLDVMTKLYDSGLEQDELEERQRDVREQTEIHSIII